jgi:hypothetical protein
VSVFRMNGLVPSAGVEFARFAVEAYLSMLRRRERLAFLGLLRAIADASLEEDLAGIDTPEKRQAILVARQEARGWVEVYSSRLMGL